MQNKFQNKYRIPSARLQTWDYGSNGAYFITICTQNQEHYFGEIINHEMHLNEIGKLAEQYWIEIPNHFSFIELGNFVVMPNHVHGILIINKMNTVQTLHCNIQTLHCDVQTLQCNVSTDKNNQMALISPKPGSIPTIIRSYKSIVTKMSRNIHADFGWQPRFYDHIIRNATSFENIQNYILENPEKWDEDKFK